MDNLEKYIKNNLNAFDEEPAGGHFDRFKQKQKAANRRKIISLWTPVSVAASLAVIFSVELFSPSSKPTDVVTVVCEQTADMKSCYLGKMNDMAAQIDVLTLDMDKWDRRMVQDEVASIIVSADDMDKMLSDELPAQETKQIMASYYKQSLESLESIVQLINENK